MEVALIIVFAFIIGYLFGRSERKYEKPKEPKETHNLSGKSIVSPVDGRVHFFCENGQSGVSIEPMQGKIYAPISGKIVKLYPMGNAFILQGADGTELLIRVGRKEPDELCSMYFRSRIVENEVVNKGKLLLEFDKESLLAAGEDANVTVYSQGSGEEVLLTEKETVKVGEEMFQIIEPSME